MMDKCVGLAQKIILTFCFLWGAHLGMAQDARNYGFTGYDGTFSTGTNASLEDMSSGTTQLIGAGVNNQRSSVINIGFDVWFMGVRYTQFSVNIEGVIQLGATQVAAAANSPSIDTGLPRLCAFASGSLDGTGEVAPQLGDWSTASSTGQVHYKAIGTSPNRVLVVEWEDILINFRSSGPNYATFQIHLYETAPAPTTTDGGEIIFIYGEMPIDITDSDGDDRSISSRTGIGAGGALGDYLHVNTESTPAATTTNTFTGTGGTAFENELDGTTETTVPNLHSPTTNSRRFIRFEADAVTGVPSNLSASCITTSTIDLSWSDPGATNGVGIVIYRSTDGTNYSFLTQTDIGDESYQDTGLTGGTTYYYRLYVVNEGKMSDLGAEASLTVATAGGTSIAYAIRTGNWNSASTWSTGSQPDASTSVVVSCNYTVTITANGAVCDNLTIASGSTLDFSNNGGLDIGGNLSNAGTFDMSTTTNGATLAGNLTNSGLWNVGSSSTFTFDGTAAQSVSNTGTSSYVGVAATTTTTYTNSTALSIPDNGSWVNRTISVPTSATITDVNLVVDIEHTYIGDLLVGIQSPNATFEYALNRPSSGGCGQNDIDATFDEASGIAANDECNVATPTISGTVNPQGNFDNYNGEDPQGTWYIFLRDRANDDTGQLNSFSLVITTSGGSSTINTNDLAFYNLVINNANGVTFIDDDARVVNNATLTSGIVAMGANEMIFIDGATSDVGGNTNHVTGTIRKIGDDAFDFPIGNGSYIANLSISAPSATSDEFTVSYTRSDPDATWDTDTKANTIYNVSRVEYWVVEHPVGSSAVYLSVSYDNTRSGGVGMASELTVAHWTSGSWADEGRHNSLTPANYTGLTSSGALSSFSPITLASTNTSGLNPLPVTLLNFTADKKDEGVFLEWQTASELNSDYFAVERSLDGKTFDEVGSIEAQGTTTQLMDYHFWDYESVLKGQVYYRLKMVDQDGSFEYSQVKSIQFDALDFELSYVAPNPFSDQVRLEYVLPQAGLVNARIIDLLGHTLYTKQLMSEKGINEMEVTQLQSLSKGSYILQLQFGNKTISKKLIK